MSNYNNKMPLGIYIHFPFCVRKCRYCDFLSFPVGEYDAPASCKEGRAIYTVDEHIDFEAYMNRLQDEVDCCAATFADTFYIDSVFFGGGTPSLIAPVRIEEIMETMYMYFSFAHDAEVTLECNPGTVDEEKLREFKAAGINRLSIGVQSFNDSTLAYLGRIHDAQTAIETVESAKSAGFTNISIDLMFGIPGQDLQMWEADVDQALALDLKHISMYSLQVEEDTDIFDEVFSGSVDLPDEIEDRRMYHLGIEKLARFGYEQYEISNFALPGYESRHNIKYWTLDDYLGLGLGAHSFIDGVRFFNTESMVDYLSSYMPIQMVTVETDRTMEDEMSEFVFLGLRQNVGISLKDFEYRFGKNWDEVYGYDTDKLVLRGLLEHSGDRLRLTELGRDLANQVFVEFVAHDTHDLHDLMGAELLPDEEDGLF
ncbi:MAG: radical SAM family heme chaperone HemW [Clostridiales Family XIII bacterium]|jgi:oxygen-independent coproporphyrinogen-3 oxidase|nr:radical SAM family heme chaperone HemW [Clostridiales Family XIII bacterium]